MLQNTLRAASASTKYTLTFHVPPSSLESVKRAIFAAGAGRYPGPGNYTECCFTTTGTGQFRPGDTANPNIGTVGALEKVEEVKVETLVVGAETVKKAVEALKMYVQNYYIGLRNGGEVDMIQSASV
ncbi:hypothetical protein BDV18DRAFT_146930 [Aspergillus unguis]